MPSPTALPPPSAPLDELGPESRPLLRELKANAGTAEIAGALAAGEEGDAACAGQLTYELGQASAAVVAAAVEAAAAAATPEWPDLVDEETLAHEASSQAAADASTALASAATQKASLYYDASTMASLNAKSVAAINRLRAYKPPPFPVWERLPVCRRAAVLLLLYADRWGDLRVVITLRAANLRSFSGHAALPGGKADSTDETPYQIARREAFEEIGLPVDDARIPRPFRIETLCTLPPSLARTHLVVLPCVAFLHADRPGSPDGSAALAEDSLIPRLDAREVAAVFSAPFYNFLKVEDLTPRPGQRLPPGPWYEGDWVPWKDTPWRVHNFYVPVNEQKVSKPRRGGGSSSVQDVVRQGSVEGTFEEPETQGRFKVWGMTGRLLVDAARIAYGEEPEMEHNETYGDADIILRAEQEGALDKAEGRDKRRNEEDSGGTAKM